MQYKPRLSLNKIWNMSMGFLGIQMAFALQNGNASRILATYGADVEELSWFWLVAPITGLIVQPLVGHFSDRTWTRLGRRKPYFVIGAILAALGLILMPNASIIAGESLTTTKFLHISLVLWVSIAFLALMDVSINISMEPFRALVGDLLPKEQGTVGFSIQTILISIGAIIGSFLPWILHELSVPNTAPLGEIAPNVVLAFYIGALVLLVSIAYTVITTKEYAPKVESQKREEGTKKEKMSWNIIVEDCVNMPREMRQLGFVQFFSWFALFTMWVYTTSAVATHHYGLSPEDTQSQTFNDAGDWVGGLFGWYSFFALIFAFLLPFLTKLTSRKKVHMTALLSGAVGLLSMYFIKDPQWLILSMVGIGFAWASILAMPYALLIDVIPQHKMGIYMGIFNFFIVIPQIINGFIGGLIVKHVCDNRAIYYLGFGGVLFILAALFTGRVKES